MPPLDEEAELSPLLRAALDQSADAIAIFAADASLGSRIVYANASFCALSGYDRADLVGHSALLLAGARPDLAHVRTVLGAWGRPFRTTVRKRRPDGSTYDVEMAISPLRDPLGAVSHCVLTQRETPREARAVGRADPAGASDALLRELRSMGRFASGVGYELEPHVAVVAAGVRDALRAVAPRGPDDGAPDAWTSLRQSLEAAERIRDTVRGLRAFATADEQVSGPVAVHEALELALQLAAPEVSARATLVRHYAPLPPVRATLSRLAHVFLNLLRNAAESIPPSIPFANSIHVETKVDTDGRVSVEIADTGIGIDSSDLPYLFDPFFTTKSEAGGSGLGLAMAQHTIAELGGDIAVESLIGRGSRFRVTLPAAPATTEAVLPDFFPDETPPPQRVLCVATTPVEARLLGRLFAGGSTRVFYASGAEAFEQLAVGERYDLVACDAPSACDLRARVRRVAPDMLGRVFDVAVPKNEAVVARRPERLALGEHL